MQSPRIIESTRRWYVDFAYTSSPFEVLIATVDLRVKDPLPKAEHLLAQWHDILLLERQFRRVAVFRRNGHGPGEDAERLIRRHSDVSFEQAIEKASLRRFVANELPPSASQPALLSADDSDYPAL